MSAKETMYNICINVFRYSENEQFQKYRVSCHGALLTPDRKATKEGKNTKYSLGERQIWKYFNAKSLLFVSFCIQHFPEGGYRLDV